MTYWALPPPPLTYGSSSIEEDKLRKQNATLKQELEAETAKRKAAEADKREADKRFDTWDKKLAEIQDSVAETSKDVKENTKIGQENLDVAKQSLKVGKENKQQHAQHTSVLERLMQDNKQQHAQHASVLERLVQNNDKLVQNNDNLVQTNDNLVRENKDICNGFKDYLAGLGGPSSKKTRLNQEHGGGPEYSLKDFRVGGWIEFDGKSFQTGRVYSNSGKKCIKVLVSPTEGHPKKHIRREDVIKYYPIGSEPVEAWPYPAWAQN